MKISFVADLLKIEMPLDVTWRYQVCSLMFWGEVRTEDIRLGVIGISTYVLFKVIVLNQIIHDVRVLKDK